MLRTYCTASVYTEQRKALCALHTKLASVPQCPANTTNRIKFDQSPFEWKTRTLYLVSFPPAEWQIQSHLERAKQMETQ